MEDRIPIMLLGLANDEGQSLDLIQEREKINEKLQRNIFEGQIRIEWVWPATKQKIFDRFNLYNNDVVIFHYCGHSNSNYLFLEDGKLQAKYLGMLATQAKELKLLFLNGCENIDQVKQLLDLGIPAIIATSRPIGDDEAIKFATYFYAALAEHKTIAEAYDTATAQINNEAEEVLVFERTRGLGLMSDDLPDELVWGLYTNRKQEALGWKIPDVKEDPNIKKAKAKLRNGVRRKCELELQKTEASYLSKIKEHNWKVLDNRFSRRKDSKDYTCFKGSLSDDIQDRLRTFDAKVLITGPPGSGKSIALCDHILKLLDSTDSQTPTPIYLHLSTWKRFVPLIEWLENQINSLYDIPKDYVRKIILDSKFMLCLDGLDELDEHLREPFIEIINEYQKDRLQSAMITCRTKEYDNLGVKIKNFIRYDLDFLQMEDVEEAIQECDFAEVALKELHGNEKMQRLIKTPLLLSLYVNYLSDRTVSGKRKQENWGRNNILSELWDGFIKNAYRERYSETDEELFSQYNFPKKKLTIGRPPSPVV